MEESECVQPVAAFRYLSDPDDLNSCGPVQGSATITDVLRNGRRQLPVASDEVFVVDRADTLDRYLYKDDLSSTSKVLSITNHGGLQ